MVEDYRGVPGSSCADSFARRPEPRSFLQLGFITRLSICVFFLIAPPGVFAQEADTAVTDAIITGNQVEAAQQDAARRQQLPEVSAREGGDGPFILIKEPIFNVTLRTGLGYSDNPSTTADDPENDASHSLLFDVGVDTRIRQLDVGGHAYIGRNKYFDLDDLDSAYAAGFIYIGGHLAGTPSYLRLQLDRGSNFDSDFDDSSPYFSARASWSRSFEVAPVLPSGYAMRVTPSVSYTRFDYRNDALDYSAYSAAVSLSQRLTGALSGSLNLSATKRDYDNFFETSTGVARDDDNIAVSVHASYAITKLLSLSLSGSWTDNSSSLDTSEYDAFNFGANLRFTKPF